MLRRLYSSKTARRIEELRKVVAPSRGSQVNEIHKRLTDYNRLNVEEIIKDTKYTPESLISETLLRRDENFDKVKQFRQRELSRKFPSLPVDAPKVSFPLEGIKVEAAPSTSSDDSGQDSQTVAEDNVIDRGFYVEAGTYVDEYVAGSASEIVDVENMMSTRMVFGADDAVEHIDFQLPGQRTGEEAEEYSSLTGSEPLDWSEQFGMVDPDRPVSNKNCSGCGAAIHCKDSSLPGFLPVELFDKVTRKRHDDHSTLCKRCYLLKHHDFLLNVNVCPVDYESMMSHLKLKDEALVLLVVDVTDLPGSIHRHLPSIIGTRKPMIVIGNKVDLLPPDARCGYLKNFRSIVQKCIEEAGFLEKFNVLHTALISAKTGYGVEDLITEIHTKFTTVKYGLRSDVYLVGCTNAGKSTLFNAFLQSDLCKVRAVDLVERATTSVWPGTTISLLKFPVMKPSPYRLEMRRRRLMKNKAWEQKEMYARKLLLQETGDAKYAVATGLLQNTYKEQEDELQPVAISQSLGDSEKKESDAKRWSIKDPVFEKGTWCYDTPGTVNENQIINFFTLDELLKVLPRKILQPRTCLLPVGQSLVIGGVARYDLMETKREHAVYLTVFANSKLPLNMMPTGEVDRFLANHLGSSSLVVPCGGPERMKSWPVLEGEEFYVKGKKTVGSVDLVMSSVGWAMVTTSDPYAVLKVWTPSRKGLFFRDPILPFSAELRGKRIPGTQFYKVEPLAFPVNKQRIQAEKNKRKYKKKN